MRICRFEQDGKLRFGLLESVSGQERITRASPVLSESGRVLSFADGEPCSLALAEVKPGVPVQPSKIVCVGRNYREHASELGNQIPLEPLIFLKPTSALLDPGQTIVRPAISTRVDYEGELGVVIGKDVGL
jgi:2-keto-4-pentenoate hydratase/2-oxohepta-3-ene-1,7-dioic acid hydratase in catechol pathway